MSDISSILTRAPFTQAQRKKRWRALVAASGGGVPAGLRIEYSGATIFAEDTANGAIGTASLPSGVTGTPTWSLTDNAGGKVSINSGSGVVSKAAAWDYDTDPSFSFIIHVTGVTPALPDRLRFIFLTNVIEDTTPVSFSFTDVVDAALSTVYESNTVTISGMDGAGDVAISGAGEYSKNGAAYTNSAGSAVNGDTFKVRVTSSSSSTTAVHAVLSVGGNVTSPQVDTFTVTTILADTTPDAFSFTDITEATISTQYTSNMITVAGINSPATVTITGGEYSKNAASYTSAAGTASLGDTFRARVTSSGSFSTAVNAVLTIGGVSDTYSVTTGATPDLTAPTISVLSPADNETAAGLTGPFVIVFSETVTEGTAASFRLYKTTGDFLVEEFDETDFDGAVVITGDEVEITWTADLDPETDYYVQIDAGSVEDVAGNPFAGIANETTWNFTTSVGSLPAPTLELHPASDTGTLDDNETEDTTPNLILSLPSYEFEENAKIYIEVDGVEADVDGIGYHLVTAGEAGGDPLDLSGLGTLTVDTHYLRAKYVSPVDIESAWSAVLTLNIVAAAGFSAEVQAWLDETTLASPADDAYITPIAAMIDDLVATTSSTDSSTLWSRVEGFWLFANKTFADGAINIAQPTLTPASAPNTIGFTASQGILPATSGLKYVDSNFNPTVHSALITNNLGHIAGGIISSRTTAATSYLISSYNTTTSWTALAPNSASTAAYFSMNDFSFNNHTTAADVKGIWLLNHTSGTDKELYRNGSATPVEDMSGFPITGPPISLNYFIGALNTNGTASDFGVDRITFISVGGVWKSSADAAAFMTIVNTCLAALPTPANGY